jgi:hypothetical protein
VPLSRRRAVPEALLSPRCPPDVCVAVVLGDALRRVSVLGGREGMPRSLGSVLGGCVTRFLGGSLRGVESRVVTAKSRRGRVRKNLLTIGFAIDGHIWLVSTGRVLYWYDLADGSESLLRSIDSEPDDFDSGWQPHGMCVAPSVTDTFKLLVTFPCDGTGPGISYLVKFGNAGDDVIRLGADDDPTLSRRRPNFIDTGFASESDDDSDTEHVGIEPVGMCASSNVIVYVGRGVHQESYRVRRVRGTNGETDDFRVLVTDRRRHYPLRTFAPPGTGDGQLSSVAPQGVCFLDDDRRIAVVDPKLARVSVFSIDGAFIRHVGDATVLRAPTSVACCNASELIVGDQGAIYVFDVERGDMLMSFGPFGRPPPQADQDWFVNKERLTVAVCDGTVYAKEEHGPRLYIFS